MKNRIRRGHGLGLLLWGLIVGASGLAPLPAAPEAPAPAAASTAAPAESVVPPAVQEAVLDWEQGVQIDTDLRITQGTDPLMPFGVF